MRTKRFELGRNTSDEDYNNFFYEIIKFANSEGLEGNNIIKFYTNLSYCKEVIIVNVVVDDKVN